jgi:capsular polysaccharide biosynthesis protein
MRTLMRWATRLYPGPWRARYGAEFDALLEDVGPRGGDVWNIVRGALAMQLTTWNFWKILAACTVAGALIAGVWSLTMPDRYISTAVMRIDGDDGDMVRLRQLQEQVLSRKSLSGFIIRGGLYAGERSKEPLEDVIAQMRGDVRIRSIDKGTGKRAFTVQFKADSPTAAQATVRTLVSAFAEQNVQVREARVNLEVLDPASFPTSPSEPSRSRVVIAGAFVGVLLGLAATRFRRSVRIPT